MKRLVISMIVGLALVLCSVSTVLAAKPEKWPDGGKPQDVITMSNGFPSGAHETLNIHGKKADYQCEECVVCPTCDPPVLQCNVINIPEYGEATIIYVSGRKVKIDELTVFDSCAGWDGDNPLVDDPAEVWLPYEAGGYWVFARALGKPAKGDPNDPLYEPRSIIFENADLEPTVFSLFGEVTNPDDVPLMLPLGLITKDGAYEMMSTDTEGEEIHLVRFDSKPEGKGKGKTLGKDITDMFMWSGWVFQPILDLNGDGKVDELDVPIEYDLAANGGNENGIIDPAEFQNWLDDNTEGYVFPLSLDLNEDGVVDELDVPIEYDLAANGGNENGIIDPWDGIYDPLDVTEPNSEFERWLVDNIPTGTTISDYLVDLWEHYADPVWVFTIADLVYQNQVVANQGIKNLQIRFYPVATTGFDSVE